MGFAGIGYGNYNICAIVDFCDSVLADNVSCLLLTEERTGAFGGVVRLEPDLVLVLVPVAANVSSFLYPTGSTMEIFAAFSFFVIFFHLSLVTAAC